MTKAPLRLLLLAAAIAASAGAHAQVCGALVTRNMTLTADMVCPAGDAVVIGNHNVAIDLNGFDIIGPGSGATRGVVSSGFDGIKIVGPGRITGFFTSVTIDGGDYHEIRDVDARALGYGIMLFNSSGSVVERSRVGFTGLWDVEANQIIGNDADSIHLQGCLSYKNVIAKNRIHPGTQFTAVNLSGGVSGTEITANQIEKGTILIGSSSENLVADNIIDNTGPSWIYAGVALAGYPSGCAGGATVDATNNLVRGNTITGAPVGVLMAAGSRHNTIIDNKIYDQQFAGLRFVVDSDYNDGRRNAYRQVLPAVDVMDWGHGNLWP